MTPVFTAIGNACTDLVASVDDSFLKKHGIRKFFCTHLTSPDHLKSLKDDLPSYQAIPGGAGANVAHVVSGLGGKSYFISKIAADPYSTAFKDHIESNGVHTHFPAPAPAEIGSSQVVTLITPDGERTFVSYDGAAQTFSSQDYDFKILKETNILYLDGYSFCSKETGESFKEAAIYVRQNGGKTIFNPGDISILEANETAITSLLQHCDGIICNMPEAEMLFRSSEIQKILGSMLNRFSIGAITDGSNGAHIFANTQSTFIPAKDISDLISIDTNGAGDHFSAGFLYGLMNGYDLIAAGQLGHACAKDCLSHTGARPLGGYGSLKHLADSLKS